MCFFLSKQKQIRVLREQGLEAQWAYQCGPGTTGTVTVRTAQLRKAVVRVESEGTVSHRRQRFTQRTKSIRRYLSENLLILLLPFLLLMEIGVMN